jgi:hypothetical protein
MKGKRYLLLTRLHPADLPGAALAMDLRFPLVAIDPMPYPTNSRSAFEVFSAIHLSKR